MSSEHKTSGQGTSGGSKWSTLPTGRRWEVYFSALTLTVTLLTLLLGVQPDLLLVIVILSATVCWTVMLDQSIRRREHETDGFNWAPYRQPFLGIATPVIVMIVLLVRYDVGDLLGSSVPDDAGAFLGLFLSLAAAPWIFALVSLALVVMPGKWMVGGARRIRGGETLSGLSSIIGSSAWFIALLGTVSAAMAIDTPTFGRPGFAGEMVTALLGLDDSLVDSPAWLLVAQACFITTFVVAPAATTILRRLLKRREPNGPHEHR